MAVDLQDLVAVVTGASSGLGRRIALELARRGAVVVGVARREAELEALAGELRATSPSSACKACDVSDTDAFAKVLAAVAQAHGTIDLLVNAAGIERRSDAADADLDVYRATLETNFFAAVAGTLAVLPGMLARGRGYVVNVSSDQARAPTASTSAYSASKAALSTFTESVANETHATGVHLHVLYPGWVPTALGQGAVDAGMPRPPRVVRRTEEQIARAVVRALGNGKVEINAARVATFAPVVRVLAPRAYHRMMRKASGR